jgi:adenylate cyclase
MKRLVVMLCVLLALLALNAWLANQDRSPAAVPTPSSAAEPAIVQGIENNAFGKARIAVLPFVPDSNGPDDDYLAEGFTVDLADALTQLPQLTVTAEASVFDPDLRDLAPAGIGGLLGVNHLVEGSVWRAGERLKIKARLLRARDGSTLWSQTYERSGRDTYAIRDTIAEDVAGALGIEADEPGLERLRQAGSRNAGAIIEYRKGREQFNRAFDTVDRIGALRRANVHFERASALAGGYPPADLAATTLFVRVLESDARGILDGAVTPTDVRQAPDALRLLYGRAFRESRVVGRKLAIDHDGSLLLGHWQGLVGRAERTLAVPGCGRAHWIRLSANAFGRAAAAHDAFAAETDCNPLRPEPWTHRSWARLWQGDAGRALAVAEQGFSAAGRDDDLAQVLTLALSASGRAHEVAARVAKVSRTESGRLFSVFLASALAGEAEAARNRKNAYLARYGPDDRAALLMEAAVGDRNEANRLAVQIDRRTAGYLVLLQAVYRCSCGAPFDLEATPRFAGMLEDAGLAWPPPQPIRFPLKNW